MSYTKLIYHTVFRTKYNAPAIDMAYERDLYAYMAGIVRNLSSTLLCINGMPEHLHLAVDMSPMISISDFMKTLKGSSSKWLANNPNFPLFRGWGEGYAAFSYSIAEKDTVCAYIRRQKEHHLEESFVDEYRQFIIRHGCSIDERYFMKD